MTMVDSLRAAIQVAIDKAKNAQAARRLDAEARAAGEDGEIRVLGSYAHLKDRLTDARNRVESLREALDFNFTGDFVKSFAEQAAIDGDRLQMLCTELAGKLVVQSNRDQILAGISTHLVGAAECELAEFEKAHGAVLKRHGLL
jgi:hypothetical protein